MDPGSGVKAKWNHPRRLFFLFPITDSLSKAQITNEKKTNKKRKRETELASRIKKRKEKRNEREH